jgi:hypothetical protein
MFKVSDMFFVDNTVQGDCRGSTREGSFSMEEEDTRRKV